MHHANCKDHWRLKFIGFFCFTDEIDESIHEDVTDKENEQPVNSQEFIPCLSLDQYQDQDSHQLPDDLGTKSPKTQQKTPNGELPQFKRNFDHNRKEPFKHRKPRLHILKPHRRNEKRNYSGLRQVLSPKAKYATGPPASSRIISCSSGGSSSAPMSSSSSGSGSGLGSSSGSRMGSKRSGNSLNGSNNNNGELDLENLEYPDSPTSNKWFADNSDLSPLTVLDNINLKTEFPYSSGAADIDKPPDINSITLDTGAETLFQFAASVPNVPDNSATFLDIGADTFSQSLYDDLGDINMNDFHNVGSTSTVVSTSNFTTSGDTLVTDATTFATMAPVGTTLTTVTMPNGQASITTTGGHILLTKPVTLEKIETVHTTADPLTAAVNISDLVRLKPQPKVEVDGPNFSNILPINNIQVTTNDQGVSFLKGLIEPLPASALKGLIKIEPGSGTASNAPTVQVAASAAVPTYKCINSFIKVEQPDHINLGGQVEFEQMPMEPMNPVFSPLSLGSSSMASPGSPTNSTSPGLHNGGGKMKSSPARKKSTSSNTTEEDDISNIPSLQTRIQIISQRVSLIKE